MAVTSRRRRASSVAPRPRAAQPLETVPLTGTLELQAPLAFGEVMLRVPEFDRLSVLARFLVHAAGQGRSVNDVCSATQVDPVAVGAETDALIEKKVLRVVNGRLRLERPLGEALAKRLSGALAAMRDCPRVVVNLFDDWWQWEDRVAPDLIVETCRERLLPARVFRAGLLNPNTAGLVRVLRQRHERLTPADLAEGHVEAVFRPARGAARALRRSVPLADLALPAKGVRVSDGAPVRPPPPERGGVWFSRWMVPASFGVGATSAGADEVALDRTTGVVYAMDALEPLRAVTITEVPAGVLSLPEHHDAAALLAALRGGLAAHFGVVGDVRLRAPFRLFTRSRVARAASGA